MRTDSAPVVVAMVVFDGFEALDLIAPLSLFQHVPGLKPLLVADRKRAVTANAGLASVTADASYEEARDAAVVFVPGGSGIAAAIEDRELIAFLADCGSRAAYVTSVCTGSLILGAAGLLEGYRAATHWRSMDLLPLVGAHPVAERVVKDRNRITGGGVTAGLDFGLTLIAELFGERAAMRAQLELEYDPAPPYSAGNPARAHVEVVDAIVEATAERQAHRKGLLERAAARARGANPA